MSSRAILLIDDTWTSGASVQSAAAALKAAGAGNIGVVTLGRHVKDTFEDHKQIYNKLPKEFRWDICAVHTAPNS